MAKGTPNLRTIKRVEKIRKLIEKGYEELERLSNQLVEKYGENEFVYELNEEDADGHKYARLTITDNLKKLAEEGKLFSAASFRKYDVKVKRLKRKPKELNS
jgi:hypothetical protein